MKIDINAGLVLTATNSKMSELELGFDYILNTDSARAHRDHDHINAEDDFLQGFN